MLVRRVPIRATAERVEVCPAAWPYLQLGRDSQRSVHIAHDRPRGPGQREVASDHQRAVRGGVGAEGARGRLPRPRPYAYATTGARRPDGGEEDAEDGDVGVDADDVRTLDVVGVAEDEDELRDVEDDGEDEVGERDPEEGADARGVGVCVRRGVLVGCDARYQGAMKREP